MISELLRVLLIDTREAPYCAVHNVHNVHGPFTLLYTLSNALPLWGKWVNLGQRKKNEAVDFIRN